MQDSISLIIPIIKTDDALKQCLKSVGLCSPSPSEIILVIDGDTGQVLPQIETAYVKIVRLPESGGPARARNKGVKEASGDILLFIDADVIVPHDICTRISKAFATESKPDAVFGSYDDKPSEQDTVSQYKNLLHHFTHQNSQTNAFTFWTGCGAILRSRFIELEGFSEEYLHPSIEDIELGYRLKHRGGTILLDKTIQVTHLKKWGLINLLRTDFLMRAFPWSKLILKYGTINNDMNINLSSRISVVLSWLLLLSLPLTFLSPFFILPSALFFFLVLIQNRKILKYFNKTKGLLFTLKIIPLHILYFLISGLAFSMSLLTHMARRKGSPKDRRLHKDI